MLLEGVEIRFGWGDGAVIWEFVGGGTLGGIEGTGVPCLALAAEASISANALESRKR